MYTPHGNPRASVLQRYFSQSRIKLSNVKRSALTPASIHPDTLQPCRRRLWGRGISDTGKVPTISPTPTIRQWLSTNYVGILGIHGCSRLSGLPPVALAADLGHHPHMQPSLVPHPNRLPPLVHFLFFLHEPNHLATASVGLLVHNHGILQLRRRLPSLPLRPTKARGVLSTAPVPAIALPPPRQLLGLLGLAWTLEQRNGRPYPGRRIEWHVGVPKTGSMARKRARDGQQWRTDTLLT